MKPDSTTSAIRPSMMALVSTTMRGSPLARAARPSGVGRRTRPIASAATSRSSRLATVRPDHAEPEEDRHAERQPRARAGPAKFDSGRPRSRPIRRPISRPTTAVTNSAVDSCLDLADEPAAGTTVRYGRTPKPDHEPGDDPAATTSAPAYGLPGNRPPPERRQVEPDEPPSAAPRRRMLRIKGALVRCPRTVLPAAGSP